MAHVLVVGAGPAGAGLAYLLADRGIEVTLLERQLDFAREFRGEVLLPGGIEALEQMGLGAALASVPQQQPSELTVYFRRELVLKLQADPSWFGAQAPRAVSQPALLEAIVATASQCPTFQLLRGATLRDLLRDGERIVGARVHTAQGERMLRADLVIGADGRASAVRRRGGFEAREQAPPMDVVWFKLPAFDAFRGARAYVGSGHLLLAYQTWDGCIQVAWVILKGSFGKLRRHGVEEWVGEMAEHVSADLAAHLRAHRAALVHPFLLDAISDRVTHWSRPGALLIGDAAHTMSPVGGQGLNVALRDAIAAANHLIPALRSGAQPAALDAAARAVEAERLPEIATIQRAQAIPPRLVLTRAWWGEPLRRVAALGLRSGIGRSFAAAPARLFLFGTKSLRLRV